MPRQKPPGVGAACAYGIIATRPEIALRIALITNAWNLFESNLLTIYSDLMRRAFTGSAGNIGSHGTSVPSQIFDELESFRAKQDLFERLLEEMTPKELFREYKDGVRQKVINASKARSRTVHTLWGVAKRGEEDVFPDAVVSIPVSGGGEIWFASDFDVEWQKIWDAGVALRQFYHERVKTSLP